MSMNVVELSSIGVSLEATVRTVSSPANALFALPEAKPDLIFQTAQE